MFDLTPASPQAMSATSSQLNTAIASSQALLTDLAADSDRFWDTFEKAFGDTFDRAEAETLRQQWIAGEFDALPEVEAIAGETLAGALGAYATATDTVYVSQEFVNTATVEQVAAVLLEEIGHGLDARVNEKDSAGDEGEIFSALARGLELSATQLGVLRQQGDSTDLVLDGEVLAVEQSTLAIVVDTLEDSVDGDFSEGDRSLREALEFIADGGTITFADSLANQTIILNGSELLIDRAVTIDGDAQNITLDANGNSRVLNVDDGDFSNEVAVSVAGLTFTGGTTTESGGGIRNNESLALSNSTITGNSTDSFGGGISNLGSLELANSTVSTNSAGRDGGGI
ncbi:MAG: hypothetical protein AAFY15_15935, partial [Cyanobacteria bacterium J06648_11]